MTLGVEMQSSGHSRQHPQPGTGVMVSTGSWKGRELERGRHLVGLHLDKQPKKGLQSHGESFNDVLAASISKQCHWAV